MDALDSAHGKLDVWIEVEFLPLYLTGAVDSETTERQGQTK